MHGQFQNPLFPNPFTFKIHEKNINLYFQNARSFSFSNTPIKIQKFMNIFKSSFLKFVTIKTSEFFSFFIIFIKIIIEKTRQKSPRPFFLADQWQEYRTEKKKQSCWAGPHRVVLHALGAKHRDERAGRVPILSGLVVWAHKDTKPSELD